MGPPRPAAVSPAGGEVREHGEDAPVVILTFRQLQLPEDVPHVRASTVRSLSWSRFAMPVLVSPSAMSSSTVRSRS